MLFCVILVLIQATSVLSHFAPSWLSHDNDQECLISDAPSVYAERTYFYVGGQYVNATVPGTSQPDQYMVGQIYVEKLVPHTVKKSYPIVFIHGSGQTGTNWLNTPDNREGWASYFLRQGYIVFITDQPQRGRSPWLPGSGHLSALSTTATSSFFTAPEALNPLPYPQAATHTQWPGTGRPDDPIFTAFYASQVPSQTNETLTALQAHHAYSALLTHLSRPVILLTHSQSGPFGFALTDALPHLVKAHIALEPGARPFENWRGAPFSQGYVPDFQNLTYGLSILPLHYDPPIEDPAELKRMHVPAPSEDLAPCILQASPPRKLVRLAEVPVLLVQGESSFHAVFDYCTAQFLRQAGVKVEFVPLDDVGIHGNGHFVFLEVNSLEIAERVLMPWLEGVQQDG